MFPGNGYSCHFLIVAVLLLGLSTTSAAQTVINMKLTMYDDGRSCPADCDAHVVFHPQNNGTPNAHLPASEDSAHKKCVPDQECEICFDADSQSCMTVMYRGAGPHRNTFDFTPAFYEQNCSKSDIPGALAAQCASLLVQARRLEGRINCFAEPDQARCRDIIEQAKQRRAQDIPFYEACRQQGEAQFNLSRPAADQRSLNCAYEMIGTGGPNSQGKRWRKLLPGACRDNTFVGRDGLDCCSGSLFHDGPLGVECRNFYPPS